MLIVAGVILAACIVGWVLSHSSGLAGYRKIDSYVAPGAPNQSGCQAIAPQCGWCPGKLIETVCYVPNDQYKLYQ